MHRELLRDDKDEREQRCHRVMTGSSDNFRLFLNKSSYNEGTEVKKNDKLECPLL